MATHEYGMKGSKVYEALQNRDGLFDCQVQKELIQAEIDFLEQKRGEKLAQYIHRTRELFFRAYEVNLNIDDSSESYWLAP